MNSFDDLDYVFEKEVSESFMSTHFIVHAFFSSKLGHRKAEEAV